MEHRSTSYGFSSISTQMIIQIFPKTSFRNDYTKEPLEKEL
jgi:hypothetical protein